MVLDKQSIRLVFHFLDITSRSGSGRCHAHKQTGLISVKERYQKVRQTLGGMGSE
jgi:hypothetical protein